MAPAPQAVRLGVQVRACGSRKMEPAGVAPRWRWFSPPVRLVVLHAFTLQLIYLCVIFHWPNNCRERSLANRGGKFSYSRMVLKPSRGSWSRWPGGARTSQAAFVFGVLTSQSGISRTVAFRRSKGPTRTWLLPGLYSPAKPSYLVEEHHLCLNRTSSTDSRWSRANSSSICRYPYTKARDVTNTLTDSVEAHAEGDDSERRTGKVAWKRISLRVNCLYICTSRSVRLLY